MTPESFQETAGAFTRDLLRTLEPTRDEDVDRMKWLGCIAAALIGYANHHGGLDTEGRINHAVLTQQLSRGVEELERDFPEVRQTLTGALLHQAEYQSYRGFGLALWVGARGWA